MSRDQEWLDKHAELHRQMVRSSRVLLVLAIALIVAVAGNFLLTLASVWLRFHS
jgi:hypothetical protein